LLYLCRIKMTADHKNTDFGKPATDDQQCPFCNLEPSRIFADNEHAVAIYDGFPVNPGHVLIIPKRHVVSLFEVTKEERAGLFDLLDDVRCRLIAERKPDGFNIGINDLSTLFRTHDYAAFFMASKTSGASFPLAE